MGLDTVELVMEVEDKFDIVIWDAEFPELATVGDMHALILNRLQKAIAPKPEPPVCPSMASFLKVRQFFVSTFGTDHSSIRPQTRLESLLPIADREKHWFKLSAHAEMRLPNLRRTTSAIWLVFLIPLLLCGSPAAIALKNADPGIVPLVAMLAGGLAYLILCMTLANRFRPTLLPAGVETISDLMQFSQSTKLPSEAVTARYSATGTEIDRDAVWRDLVLLVCDALGVKERDIRPETRFIEDLSCG